MGIDGNEIRKKKNDEEQPQKTQNHTIGEGLAKKGWNVIKLSVFSLLGIFLILCAFTYLSDFFSDQGKDGIAQKQAQAEPPKSTNTESKCISSGRDVYNQLSSIRNIGPTISGPGTSITIFIEENSWAGLGKEKQDVLVCYMPELVKTVSLNPAKYIEIPGTAPAYQRFFSNARNMTPNSWEIITGKINSNGNVGFDRTVVKGY